MLSFAVWADSVDVPIRVCAPDARLRRGTIQPANPNGETFGQGGWDVGVHFMNLTDLATQLDTLVTSQTPPHMCASPSIKPLWSLSGCQSFCPPGGQVTRLAINAHGIPGTLYAGGEPSRDLTVDPVKEKLAISVENLPNITSDLKRIHRATAPRSTIFLMGCIAGQDKQGTELLQALSALWPERKIVAFTTIGLQRGDKMMRPGQGCTEPGMRDTTNPWQSAMGQKSPFGALWDDLSKLPWASDTSPGAKIIEDGQIVRQPDPQFEFGI